MVPGFHALTAITESYNGSTHRRKLFSLKIGPALFRQKNIVVQIPHVEHILQKGEKLAILCPFDSGTSHPRCHGKETSDGSPKKEPLTHKRKNKVHEAVCSKSWAGSSKQGER